MFSRARAIVVSRTSRASTPYYDLLKQSYLVGLKQLTDFVDQAQVDEKTRLQLKFYARQLSMR